jgi:carboxymethylenebutenolidase
MPEITTQQTEVPVSDGTKMTLHWAGPSDGGAGPGMIVLQEAFGVNSHIRDVVARFAALGFWAAAPELFHRTGPHFEGSYTDFSTAMPHMKAITQATLEADNRATFDWLKSQPKVIPDKIAAIGFCLGGRATFIANAILPLRAAISFYGGGIAPDLLPLANQQHGPILLFWGGLDQHNPTVKTRAVADALTQARKSHVHVEFSDADHGFFCDERKQYNPVAAVEAWALCLAFLKNRLTIP